MKLGLHLPINPLSFGQTSTLILKTAFEQEKAGKSDIDWYIHPIGNIDLGAQKENREFNAWLNGKLVRTMESFSRDIPTFKLWHLNGSLESISNKQTLLSFYELDNPTKVELNIARQNNICFSSKYTCDVFKLFGVEAQYLPLAFDSYNFSRLDSKKFDNRDRIIFNLCGKFEKRKHTDKVIRAWIKKFGGDRRYVLQCAINNPFFNDQQNQQLIAHAVNGQKPFNVSFYPTMRENNVYNEFLNSGNIVIGVSGAEGFGLPEFQSVCIGKHAVLLNAHSYQSWATKDSVVFVEPSNKIEVFDDVFFKKGDLFNQGNIFDWEEEKFINGCLEAIKRVESNKVNEVGLSLQKEYSKEGFLNAIIKITLNHENRVS